MKEPSSVDQHSLEESKNPQSLQVPSDSKKALTFGTSGSQNQFKTIQPAHRICGQRSKSKQTQKIPKHFGPFIMKESKKFAPQGPGKAFHPHLTLENNSKLNMEQLRNLTMKRIVVDRMNVDFHKDNVKRMKTPSQRKSENKVRDQNLYAKIERLREEKDKEVSRVRKLCASVKRNHTMKAMIDEPPLSYKRRQAEMFGDLCPRSNS